MNQKCCEDKYPGHSHGHGGWGRFLFTMEFLVAVAALGALALGEVMEALVILILYGVGNRLEAFALKKSAPLAQSVELIPKKALKKNAEGTWFEIAVTELVPGDIIAIQAREHIPADGVILTGQTKVDESLLTGESFPVVRGVGTSVVAGSFNLSGPLEILVTRPYEQNTVVSLQEMVEQAQGQNENGSVRFIQKFSRRYTPIVVLVALGVALVPLIWGGEGRFWWEKSLTILLIGCPCALVLASPSALAAGLVAALRRGIHIKNMMVLEVFYKIKMMAFDKTGTITKGILAENRPDELKDDARGVFAKLKMKGLKLVVLTGDKKQAAQNILEPLGVEFIAEMSPQDKLNYVLEKSQGMKIAMIGDGVNDAPALAASSLGITFNTGTPLAQASASVLLPSQGLSSLLTLFELSQKTMMTVKFNIFLAFFFKALVIFLMVLGYGKIWMSLVADSLAILCVMLLSLRLLRSTKETT